jgi:hypothetical protein
MDSDYKDFHPYGPAGPTHPAAPAGGAGGGYSRVPGPLGMGGSPSALPHVDSPVGRHFDWHSALPRIEAPARARAVYEAVEGSRRYMRRALFAATGQELQAIVAGILPGIMMLLGVLATTTVIGAAAGALVGALFFGAGAVPGAAVGAELGLDGGIVILNWLGIGFLVAYIGKSLLDAVKLACTAVRQAWDSVDRHGWAAQAMAVDDASYQQSFPIQV